MGKFNFGHSTFINTFLEALNSNKTFNVKKNSVIEVEEFDFGVKALKPEKFKKCQVQRPGRHSPDPYWSLLNTMTNLDK